MKCPETKKTPIADNYHGIKINDDYRWLEDGGSIEVCKWIKDQNSFAEKLLREKSNPDKFKIELMPFFNATSFTVPSLRNGKIFFMERNKNQNQFVLYAKNLQSEEILTLVDPNKTNKDGTTSLDYWKTSRDGNYVAYGLSEGGSENSTLYIKSVLTGKNIDKEIPNARFGIPKWLTDNSGFFYIKLPDPGTVPKKDLLYYYKIYFHKLGTDPKNDELIFGEDRPKEETFGYSLSEDEKYLFIKTSSNWTKNDLFVYDVINKEVKSLIEGHDAQFIPYTARDKIYLLTNYKAENFRILVANQDNIPKNVDDWDEVVPERKGVIENICFTKNKLLVVYLDNISHKIRVFDHNGEYMSKLAIPEHSSLTSIKAHREESDFFFGITNFFTAHQVYFYDSKNKKVKKYRESKNSLSEQRFSVKQEWYMSKDGTRVPMFIFHRKDIEYTGKNPTILYGYGGFGINITPSFPLGIIPLLRRGAVYAVANIRGGGEFGKSWHTDGILEKKINSYADFIATAEYLVKEKITNKEKLAIMGGSNGGLLVGATMILRPDLFKAVVSRVPLLDMVRFPKFLMAARWVHEYGDPQKVKDLKNILKWSPYHNVKKNIQYPSILFTTANKDSRVDPLHARKMAALLQNSNKDNISLVRTETEAGHGPGKSKSKQINEMADVLGFLDWQLFH